MTLHMHRPRTKQDNVMTFEEKSFRNTSTDENQVNFRKFFFFFFHLLFFYWIFNHCHFLDNTNSVILLYILSKLN